MIQFRNSQADAAPRAPGHEERAIDESIEETFPASDATTPVQPGSLVGSHYAAERAAHAALTRHIAAALAALAAIGLVGWLARR